MDRRTFLNWISIGVLANSLPVAIAACTPRGSSGSGEFKAIGSVSELDQNGQLLVESGLAKPVLVIRNPTAPETLIAVDPTCPHAGCNVQWNTGETAFVCPCHGAKYDAEGTVTQGPARQPLATYEVKLEEQQIMVKET